MKMKKADFIVTGATSTIGREVCLGLAKRGATRLGLVCRDLERGLALAGRLRKAGASGVELFTADFTDARSLSRLSEELKSSFPHVGVLIHNAGLVGAEERGLDCWDPTLAVNFLAPVLLTESMVPALRSAAPSRIVLVASRLHASHLDPEFIRGDKPVAPPEAYRQSKLALIAYGFELAKRLEGSRVTVNSLHPGVVDSRLLRALEAGVGDSAVRKPSPMELDLKGLRRRLRSRLPGSWLRTPKAAASSILYLALSPGLEAVSGAYFEEARPALPHPVALDPSVQAEVRRLASEAIDSCLEP